MASNSKSLFWRVVLPLLVLVATGFAYFFFWGRSEAQVAKVKAGTATSAVSGSVTVQAEYAMELKSEIGGRVLESAIELDARVKTGDVLVLIDSGDLRLDIERTQSEYTAAKKSFASGSAISLELDAAKEALANIERQAKLGMVSDSEVTRQKRNVKGIEQRLAQEQIARTLALENFENSLKTKQRQLEKMTITAPFDGIVTQVFARKGDLISSGAPIARLIAVGRLVEGRLSEENIAGVRVGQKAFVLLPSLRYSTI